MLLWFLCCHLWSLPPSAIWTTFFQISVKSFRSIASKFTHQVCCTSFRNEIFCKAKKFMQLQFLILGVMIFNTFWSLLRGNILLVFSINSNLTRQDNMLSAPSMIISHLTIWTTLEGLNIQFSVRSLEQTFKKPTITCKRKWKVKKL